MIDIETQKKIYQIGLMLRRKPIPFILEYAGENWGIEKSQVYYYIRLARKEWQKYYDHLKSSNMSYHMAELRDLKDEAYSRKVIIGRGDSKETVIIADLGLVFEITKEEAKLMGIYPSEKHDIKVEGELKLINAKKKLVERIDNLIAKRGKGQTTKQPD